MSQTPAALVHLALSSLSFLVRWKTERKGAKEKKLWVIPVISQIKSGWGYTKSNHTSKFYRQTAFSAMGLMVMDYGQVFQPEAMV